MIQEENLSETEALALLGSIPHVGSIKIRLLIEYFGTAQEAVSATPSQLAQLPGFGPKILSSWENHRKEQKWQKNLELAIQHRTELISYRDSRFPKRLLEITDHPVILYCKGEIKQSDQYCLAIVGTRQPTIYGQEMAEQLGEELARMGFTIVSGLARGVDTLAHKGALRAGRTIGVIGSGLANIYPKENGALGQSIAQRGALLSEFAMATPPDRQNFPQRNRIVSGMSMGTVLIEAPKESGAMITMDRAFMQKRKTFALPGRADQENFRGNHWLIKNGQALLVESAADIAQHFDALFAPLPRQSEARKPMVDLDPEEENLLRQLPPQEISFDAIVALAKLPTAKLNVLLMSLLLKKAIKEFPGKLYKRSSLGA